MKKFFVFLSVLMVMLLNSGCSATWEGVKEDTGNMFDSTKEAIHEATE